MTLAYPYNQNFDGLTAGILPTGWTNKTGSNWIVGTNGAVSSPNALGEASPADGDICLYTADGMLTDQQVSGTQVVNQGASTVSLVQPVLRSDSGGNNFYVLSFSLLAGTVTMYKCVSGTFTQLGTATSIGTTFTRGQVTAFRYRVQGSQFSFKVWLNGGTEPGWTTPGSWADSTFSSGYSGFRYGVTGSDPGKGAVDDVVIDSAATISYSVSASPNPGVNGSPSTLTVTVVGTLSAELDITPALNTISGTLASGTLTFATGVIKVPAGTNPSGTVTFTPNTVASGSFSFSHTYAGAGTIIDPGNLVFSDSASQTIIYPEDSHFWWNGFGVETGGSHNVRYTRDNGASFKFAITGTTQFTLLFDTSPYNSDATTTDWPIIAVDVDGYPIQFFAAASTVQITGLNAGVVHGVKIWKERGTITSSSLWGSASVYPKDEIRFTQMSVDSGGSMVALSGTMFNPLPKRAIIWGDSLVNGTANSGGDPSSGPQPDDPRTSAASLIAQGMGWEPALVGLGGIGYSIGYGPTSLPALTASYNLYDGFAGHTRDLTIYDYLCLLHGTNDYLNQAGTDATVSAAVLSVHQGIRAANSTGTLLTLLPWGTNTANDSANGATAQPNGANDANYKVFRHDAIVAGWTSYQNTITAHSFWWGTVYTGSKDTNAFLIDMGTRFSRYIESKAWTNGGDNIHPFIAGWARIAAAACVAIKDALALNSSNPAPTIIQQRRIVR